MKIAGSKFLIKRDIVTVGQENLKLSNLCRFKILEDIRTILWSDSLSMDGYIFTNKDNFSKIPNIAYKF